ncbi:MAG: hypothetical protein QXD23_01415 [Candidatus Micrarchaeaceae archaeon]
MKNHSNITPKIEENKNEKKHQEMLEVSMRDIFKNGNVLTLELQEKGILPKNNSSLIDNIRRIDSYSYKNSRKLNTKMEETLLKAAIRDMHESNEDSYNRYGISFKKQNGLWIQDSVEVIGTLNANYGTIIMGIVTLENVTLPSYISEFGNAFDINHKLHRIKLSGKIF